MWRARSGSPRRSGRALPVRIGQFRLFNPIGYTGVALGFISILLNFVSSPSILAIIFSSIGLRNAQTMKASGGRAIGWGRCIAGLVLGIGEIGAYFASTIS